MLYSLFLFLSALSTFQYRIGKVLGSAAHSVIKEAEHTETQHRFACKIIYKKLTSPGELRNVYSFLPHRPYITESDRQIQNEIIVSKHVGKNHNRNIITLYDYYEVSTGYSEDLYI